MSTVIWVTTRFVGYHAWASAPKEVEFLRDMHRHVFHVKAAWEVSHNDRDLEFFIQLKRLNDFIDLNFKDKRMSYSCEHMAELLLSVLGCAFVEVSEDGENGAIVAQPLKKTQPSAKQSVATLVKDKPFVGIETEGPNRGKKVLFVPAQSVLLDDFVRRIFSAAVSLEVDRIYFGAGNRRWCDLSLIKQFLVLSNGVFGVDVEVSAETDINDVPEEITIIRVVTDKPYTGVSFEPNLYHKWIVDDMYIVWQNSMTGKLFVTLVTDPLFDFDKEVAV